MDLERFSGLPGAIIIVLGVKTLLLGVRSEVFRLDMLQKLNFIRIYISGVTFSGGDPLLPENRATIFHLAKYIKQYIPGKTVWIYTGYLWEEIKDLPGLRRVDVLVDGEFKQKLADVKYHWAGSTNQRVIDVPRSLAEGRVILKED